MPSMFHLHVHTTEDIEHWEMWSDETLCTFLHEYIHFLQDISTVSGLYNIYVVGECLADHVNTIYDMSEKVVSTPIQIIQGSNNVKNNVQISDAIEGDCDLDGADEGNLNVTGKAAVTNKTWNLNGELIEMHEVRVPYQGGGDFLLGNFHITESMAYLGEQIMYGNMQGVVATSPNFPYDVVRQLASFYNVQLASNLPLLFCLCDLSLTFSHSGYALINCFEQYVKRGCPADWKQFVFDLISHTKASTPTGLVSYEQGLKRMKNMAINELDMKFNNDSYNDIRRWYYNIINRAVDMRLKYPLFIYDFLTGGILTQNKQFKQLLAGLGTPLVTNDYYQSSFTENVTGCPLKKRRIEFLIAAGSITYALGNAEFPCDLRKICKADKKCIDKNCVRAPWKHSRKILPCPYGHLWYGWGLNGKN